MLKINLKLIRLFAGRERGGSCQIPSLNVKGKGWPDSIRDLVDDTQLGSGRAETRIQICPVAWSCLSCDRLFTSLLPTDSFPGG